MNVLTRWLAPVALGGVTLLAGPTASLAGDVKVFSGSQCQPSGYASDPHIIRRGIAAVNGDSNLASPLRAVVCPIIRDRFGFYNSWPGVNVRFQLLPNFGDQRPLSCYLYSTDQRGQPVALADFFSVSGSGLFERTLKGGKRVGGGYDVMWCLLPYQAELRVYTSTE